MAALRSQDSSIVLPREYVSGKIGVVTVTFGSGSVFEDFLASLDHQTYRKFCLIAVLLHVTVCRAARGLTGSEAKEDVRIAKAAMA